MFDVNFILLLIVNSLISFSLFILALIYFLLDVRNETHVREKRTLLFAGLICGAGIANALMMRYAVEFPKVEGYDLNSAYYLVTNLISAVLSFFTYFLYLRTGQSLSNTGKMPGSILLGKMESRKVTGLNWKIILIPIPFLILWSIVWFSFVSPEPTDLALAATPEGNSLMVYVYTFFTASIFAPVTEEVLYRHFAMGLFARWFGSSKLAIGINIWLSSLIFSIAHVGVVTADWIKIIQILPIGVVFGWINHKKGLEHAILSHSLFNTFIIPVSVIIEYSVGI